MRAIILSAGRGTRLLPYTARTPKCLLPVLEDRSVLEVQLRTLAACGVREALVVVGSGAERVEEHLRERPVPGIRVRTLHNPFHAESDNLVSATLAMHRVRGDCLLLNGDTLFEREVLERLMDEAGPAVTLAVDRKPAYDADDMKVSLDGRRVRAVAKSITERVDAESIGLLLVRGDAVPRFREALATCVCEPDGLSAYYLAAVDRLARTDRVDSVSIAGLWWQEIDCAADWVEARTALALGGRRPRAVPAVAPGRRFESLRRVSSLALLWTGLLLWTAPAAPADEGPSSAAIDPSVEGAPDPWLHGPALRVYPTDGRLRPFVVGGVGRKSEPARLGIEDPTHRFPDAPYAGRAGGGLELRLDDRSSLSVEGSYLQPDGVVADEGAGTAGVRLEIRF